LGAFGCPGSLSVGVEAAQGTNGSPATKSIPKALGVVQDSLGWRCGESCSVVLPPPSSLTQASPVS